jgi:hypothetical protein
MIENYIILFAFIGVFVVIFGVAAIIEGIVSRYHARKYHAEVMDKVIGRK